MISFLLVAVITTALAATGLHFVRRKYPTEVLKENHEVAAIIFNAFGLLYGVVVAFVVFVTWSGYDDATKNLQMEDDLKMAREIQLAILPQQYPSFLGATQQSESSLHHLLSSNAGTLLGHVL